MRFVNKAKVNASADKIWKVFAHDFDDAYKWMASVPHSYAQANGERFDRAQSAGRVCQLDTEGKGIQASEQFLKYNEADKTCTVRIDFINTPIAFPVDHNTLDFSVVDIGDNQSEMTWAFSSQVKPWAYVIWPLIRVGFGIFVGQIVEELRYFVENGTPHPRKLKALNKTKRVVSA